MPFKKVQPKAVKKGDVIARYRPGSNCKERFTVKRIKSQAKHGQTAYVIVLEEFAALSEEERKLKQHQYYAPFFVYKTGYLEKFVEEEVTV